MIKKQIFFLFFALFVLFPVSAQNTLAQPKLKISLDFESAKTVAELLSHKTISEAELTKAVKLYGNQQLIKKVKAYSSSSSDELFKQTLRQAIENKKMESDPYEWQSVKKNLKELSLLINQIERDQVSFLQDINNRVVALSRINRIA